jgi:hypothetical protein
MFRTVSLLVTAAVLATALTSADAEPVEKLAFSKRILTKDGPDGLTIRNPNAEDLICDSIAVRTEDRIYGFMTFNSIGIPMLPLANGTLAPTGALRYRASVPLAHSAFRFPSRKTLTVRFPQYDPCVCKISAAAVISDTVHFEVVFHYAGLSDTLMLVADKNGTLALRKPGTSLIMPEPETGWQGFVTGRRRAAQSTPVWLARPGSLHR